jgi:hypothetical protein
VEMRDDVSMSWTKLRGWTRCMNFIQRNFGSRRVSSLAM